MKPISKRLCNVLLRKFLCMMEECLRKAKGLSQEQLAETLNIARQTISKWELNQSTPDMNYIAQLSDFFNVPYMARDFAIYSHCGFDPEKKLWFTGSLNANLYSLVRLYGVNEATSEKAMQLLKEKIGDITNQDEIADESD